MVSQHGIQYETMTFSSDFPPLGIIGSRSLEYRLGVYQFERWVNRETRLLEVGAGAGFLTYYLAQYAGSVTGLEPDPLLFQVYKQIVREIDNPAFRNARMLNCAVEETHMWLGHDERFDVVTALSLENWHGYAFIRFANRMFNVIKPNGVLMVEHPSDQQIWIPKLEILNNNGFHTIEMVDIDWQRQVAWLRRTLDF